MCSWVTVVTPVVASTSVHLFSEHEVIVTTVVDTPESSLTVETPDFVGV